MHVNLDQEIILHQEFARFRVYEGLPIHTKESMPFQVHTTEACLFLAKVCGLTDDEDDLARRAGRSSGRRRASTTLAHGFEMPWTMSWYRTNLTMISVNNAVPRSFTTRHESPLLVVKTEVQKK